MRLGQAIAVQQEVYARYQELEKFREEYRDAMAVSGRQGMAASRIQEFQTFIEKLNNVIDEQGRLLSVQENRVNEIRAQWYSHRKALSGVENCMEEVIRQERAAEEVIEQKEMDELAKRKYLQRNY